jgi:hypothetical protein
MKSVHFPEVEACVIPALSPHLVHHHITIPFPHLNPGEIARFSFAVAPREIRVHIWTSSPGFPTEASSFCTHLLYPGILDDNGMGHDPELVRGGPLCRNVCGRGPTEFVSRLNIYVREEFRKPVKGLVALRVAITALIARMLEDGSST